ncbi:hypothetical protein WN51_00840 [Melipona quadrifasciata]|uniref:Uncharacterized protein n=1 Tax=Melipona quadrifasciata TaxID=166423 RepID=A0A0N0BKS1_9HYME|nr:hypothetical protein WN51_00840 [Melipona quadrifasciata]
MESVGREGVSTMSQLASHSHPLPPPLRPLLLLATFAATIYADFVDVTMKSDARR